MTSGLVTLSEAETGDCASFKTELQDAFAVAVVEAFGELPGGPIPSDEVLDGALHARGAVVQHVLCDGRRVGGAVLRIDANTHRTALDLFFLRVGEEGHGLGSQAWLAIEHRCPETIIWQTRRPYFEGRNIHVYANKCGFKIIEFFNRHNSDPDRPAGPDGFSGDEEAFRSETGTKPSGSVH